VTVVHEHSGASNGDVYCRRCQQPSSDLGIAALWTYLPEYVTCPGSASDRPVSAEAEETE
jgi:hypothetical protein